MSNDSTLKISRAVCLVHDSRLEQFNTIESSFGDHGIKVTRFLCGDGKVLPPTDYQHIDVEVPPGWVHAHGLHRPPMYNARLCHYKIINQAVVDGCDNILMLEDDATIMDDFEETLDTVVPYFMTHAWDMIYFGWFHTQEVPGRQVHPRVYYVSQGVCGLHGVLLTKNACESILKHSHIQNPVDGVCAEHIQKKLLAFAIVPSIIRQCAGVSRCQQATYILRG